MPHPSNASVFVLAPDGELPTTARVWGTGGWIPPEDREALDWLTLAAFMGWGVWVARAGELPTPPPSSDLRCVILTGDPRRIGADILTWLQSILAIRPVLVVARAFSEGSLGARMAGGAGHAESVRGRRIRWAGPGDGGTWGCRSDFVAQRLVVGADAAVWADLHGAPLIAARSVGRGVIATLGFHPSGARDANGAATALLRHLLTRGALGPVAWLDFQDTLALRMDDPGGAQNVYSANWRYRKLDEGRWCEIGDLLSRYDARMSIGYVAGWMDDGDPRRGELTVAGCSVPRVAGRIHPSPEVRYRELSGEVPGTVHDYGSEFRGVQSLRARGLADVELHGYTHIHPNAEAWSRASDRYQSVRWYREFGPSASEFLAVRPLKEHPLAMGIALLGQYFRTEPTTLICPGDEWTDETMGRALDLKLSLVSSYYTAVRHDGRFCWTMHVCAPYLDQPDAAWFDAGLPVVGYFHDREPAMEGPQWISEWLERWRGVGAQRLIDLREMAAALSVRLEFHQSDFHPSDAVLHVWQPEKRVPVVGRPIPLLIRAPGACPDQLTVAQNGQRWRLPVERLGSGLGRALLTPLPSDGD